MSEEKPMTVEEIASEVKRRRENNTTPRQDLDSAISNAEYSFEEVIEQMRYFRDNMSYTPSDYTFKLEQFIMSKGLADECREFNDKIMDIIKNGK